MHSTSWRAGGKITARQMRAGDDAMFPRELGAFRV